MLRRASSHKCSCVTYEKVLGRSFDQRFYTGMLTIHPSELKEVLYIPVGGGVSVVCMSWLSESFSADIWGFLELLSVCSAPFDSQSYQHHELKGVWYSGYGRRKINQKYKAGSSNCMQNR